MTRSKSPECIAPSAFDNDERQQSAKVGIFNLICTMIGGGVLSLPYAISRSGLIPGFIILTLSGIASVFSFDILISSSRRTGAMTYQQIAYFAFGSKIQYIITFLILCLTGTASIAYCVLVGDLLKPILCYLGRIPDTECSSEWLRRIVIAGGILSVSPFCFMRQIKALKYTSIISITSVTILAAIITYKTVINFGKPHEIYYINHNGLRESYTMNVDIHYFPQSIDDIIYVFPVFSLAFLCHFNIPQVHSELTRPTRRRLRIIFFTVVLSCSILYATVSFFGYFHSFQYTCGNILLNYNQDDIIITAARLCLSCVVLLSFPLLILPARSSMHSLLNLLFTFKSMNIGQIDEITDKETSISSQYSTNKSISQPDVRHSVSDMDVSTSSDNIIVEQIGYGLFGNNRNTRNINSSFNEDSDAMRVNDKPHKRLQVVNKTETISHQQAVSPNEYSKSTHSLLSQRAILSYNTFNTNNQQTIMVNTKPLMSNGYKIAKTETNLDTDDSADDREISYRSTSRGFTTRSFSHLDSPLRVPQDALGVINQPEDIELLKDKDFTKTFRNLDNVTNYIPTKLWLIGETTILIGIALVVSFITDSVMVLWALIGSTVSFLIAFTLPGLFYFKIRYHRKGWTWRNVSSVVIVTVSSLAIVLCTWQALLRFDADPCPNIPQSVSV